MRKGRCGFYLQWGYSKMHGPPSQVLMGSTLYNNRKQHQIVMCVELLLVMLDKHFTIFFFKEGIFNSDDGSITSYLRFR